MSLQKLIQNYAGYNVWANEKISTWLQSLDINLLTQQVASSFTSIDYTVQHILRTQKFWTAFISEQDSSNFDWSAYDFKTLAFLQELVEQSRIMQTAFLHFENTELEKILHIYNPWAKGELPRYEYMQHVINHSTYHRGQIISIARGIGITENIPNTDYNFFNLREL